MNHYTTLWVTHQVAWEPAIWLTPLSCSVPVLTVQGVLLWRNVSRLRVLLANIQDKSAFPQSLCCAKDLSQWQPACLFFIFLYSEMLQEAEKLPSLNPLATRLTHQEDFEDLCKQEVSQHNLWLVLAENSISEEKGERRRRGKKKSHLIICKTSTYREFPQVIQRQGWGVVCMWLSLDRFVSLLHTSTQCHNKLLSIIYNLSWSVCSNDLVRALGVFKSSRQGRGHIHSPSSQSAFTWQRGMALRDSRALLMIDRACKQQLSL